jgi:hypothetical protein
MASGKSVRLLWALRWSVTYEFFRAKRALSTKPCATFPIERCSLLARLSTAMAISSVTPRAQPSAVLKATTRSGCEYWPLRIFSTIVVSSASASSVSQ